MKKSVVSFICFVLSVLSTQSLAAEIKDEKFGFELKLPGELKEYPEGVKLYEGLEGVDLDKILYFFILGDPEDDQIDIHFMIEAMGGLIGREDLSKYAEGVEGMTIFKEKWRSFEINVFRIHERFGDIETLTFNAQVPLKPEAIQLKLIGEKSREDELLSILRSALNNLSGETNWLTKEERRKKFLNGGIPLAITILIVWITIRIVTVKRRMRRSSSS